MISDNDNGSIKETHVFNDIGITPSSVIKLDVADQSADQSLNLDLAGSGNFQTIHENANLGPQQDQDLTPPETLAVVSGTQGMNGWYKGNAQVTLSATDDNSGVLVTKYSLDDGQSYQIYSDPFAINQEGSSAVKYFSVDKAGNDEVVKSLNLHIDKSAPEIQTQFDLTLKDFVFQTTDNLDPDPVISCTQTSCTATDDAGNTTILSFQKTKVLTTKNLKLLSVSYNGTTSSFQPNLLVINLVEKSGSLLDFDQGFWLKSKQVIYIDLNKPKNQSTIYTLKSNGTLTKEVVSGMRFLQVSTEKGIIKLTIK